MSVLTIAAPKSGATKTSTTCLLAVKASLEKQRVCMLDLNADQGDLTDWWRRRGKPDNPYLELDIQDITRDVNAIRASKQFDWLFIDTSPLNMDVIENSVVGADCVIVPVRTSSFDVGSVEPIIEMCRQHRKAFKLLLSAVDNRFKGLIASALAALLEDGPVFATRISVRLPYINALTAGRTGQEITKDKELQDEVTALWEEVKMLASSTAQPALRAVKDRAAND